MPPRRLLALVLAVACTPRAVPTPTRPVSIVTLDVMQADSIATAMLQLAFRADAAGTDPDSVYTEDAEIIANGEPRASAPRFAGVGTGGRVQLGSSRIAVTGEFVWGTTEYRWIPGAPGKPLVEGRATVIIGRRRDGAWRILHVHSSTTPPPESETPRPARPDTTGRTGR